LKYKEAPESAKEDLILQIKAQKTSLSELIKKLLKQDE
jgi:hypothetical protein